VTVLVDSVTVFAVGKVLFAIAVQTPLLQKY
jgi:hypothetical protein